MDIVVHGTVASRTFRVLWLLEELGLPYEHRPDGPHSAAVRALSPSGKVPVVVIDGVVLTDSTAILTYFADATGRFTCPAGTSERAQQDGLTHCILDEIEGPIWTAARHSFILPAEMRLPQIKQSLRWEFARACTRLAPRLAGPFLMGETMTIADIVLGHCLVWAGVARFDVPEPALQAYRARLCERPAYRAVAAPRT